MQKISKFSIHVTGSFCSSYCFENEVEKERWIKEDFPLLKDKYKNISYRVEKLDGLKIGDFCNVWGEGFDVFKIEQQVYLSKDRYGFVLDSGWLEEVVKCHKVKEGI